MLNAPDFTIGRETEISALEGGISRASTGSGTVFAINGDAGIGKTTLVNELSERAASSKFQVVRGSSRQTEGAPAFWPLRQAFGEIEFSRDLTADSPEELFVHSWVANTGRPTDHETLNPFGIHDAAIRLVGSVAEERPLVLILEDVHWADDESMSMIRALASESASLPVLIALTFRTVEMSDHAKSVVRDLKRNPHYSELNLAGLTEQQTGEFVARLTGAPAATMVARTLHRSTEGNPFFLLEILRSLDPEVWSDPRGAAAQGRVQIGIPLSVQGVLASRLENLPQTTFDALAAGAVLGRNFELDEVVPLIEGMTPLEMIEALEPAISAGLIVALNPSLTEFTFSHALFRESTLSMLSPAARLTLHARAGEAIEAAVPEGIDTRASELAYHFAMAAALTGPELAARYALVAARQQLEVAGHHSAVEILQRAIAITDTPSTGPNPEFRPVPNRETAEMLAMLAFPLWQLMHISGRNVDEPFSSIYRAFVYMAEHGPHEEAIRLASLPIGFSQSHHERDREILLKALEIAPPGSSGEGAVRSRYGQLLGGHLNGDLQDSMDQIDRAEEIARNRGDVNLLGWVHARRMYVAINRGRFDLAGKAADRSIEDAEKVTDAECETNLRHYISHSLMQNFRLAEAKEQADKCFAAGEIARAPGRQFTGDYARGEAAHLAGNLERSRSYDTRYAGTAQFSAKSAYIEFAMGDHDLGWELIDETRSLYSQEQNYEFRKQMTAGYLVRSMLHHRQQVGMDIVSEAWELTGDSRDLNPMDSGRSNTWLIGRGLDNVILTFATGDGPTDPRIVDLLCSYSGHVESGWTGISMAIDRGAALGARVNGDFRRSAHHSRVMLDLCTRNGYVLDAGWGALEFAELMTQQPGLYEKEEFDHVLGIALDSARKMGSTLLPLKVEEVRAKEPAGLASGGKKLPAGLTAREIDVLKLIAAGNSNRQIAEELVISQNTVIRHVSNILSKTGSTGRAEATGFAHRHGIVE